MHVAFLGFGLIAGSIARAIRANPATVDWTVVAWSPSGDGPRQAVEDGIADHLVGDPQAALAGADLVVLGAPATGCLTLIDRLGGSWRNSLPDDAVVTDVASTKARILERADAAEVRFIGGHPLAGREAAGYEASTADLFVDRPWVLVPGAFARPGDLERVEALAQASSARVVVMDAAAHDRAVAGISHLPLIAAVALVEAVVGREGHRDDDWPVAADLAASGWRDMTRLARGDPAMGAAIVATNGEALAGRVRELRDALDTWLADLERAGGPDEAAAARRLAKARALLDRP